MKKLLLFFATLVIFCTAMAQAPQGIKNQAIVRNEEGLLVTNATVGIRISILIGSLEGPVVYVETHSPESNANGLITYVIGQGVPVSGTFSSINWAEGPYFLKTEADPNGGTNYNMTGTIQLLSVPYALHAFSAEEYTESDPVFNQWNRSAGIIINESQILDLQPYLTSETQTLADVAALNNSVNNRITNVSDPTDPQDGTTRSYVDLLKARIELLENALGIIPPDPDAIYDIDGNVYSSVAIGSQEWMVENLRVTKYNNGDPIMTGLDNAGWQNAIMGAYVIYDHQLIDGINSSEEMKNAYGLLYNWYTVLDPRGVCPSGWRVATDGDWTEMVNHLGGQNSPTGNRLRSCRQVGSPLAGDCNVSTHPRWDQHAHYGTDDFGFKALPGGFRSNTGGYLSLGLFGTWWTANEVTAQSAWRWGIVYNEGYVLRNDFTKRTGMSIRCVKN
jgi:uncharacterized protein (TIGR02145 family)